MRQSRWLIEPVSGSESRAVSHRPLVVSTRCWLTGSMLRHSSVTFAEKSGMERGGPTLTAFCTAAAVCRLSVHRLSQNVRRLDMSFLPRRLLATGLQRVVKEDLLAVADSRTFSFARRHYLPTAWHRLTLPHRQVAAPRRGFVIFQNYLPILLYFK